MTTKYPTPSGSVTNCLSVRLLIKCNDCVKKEKNPAYLPTPATTEQNMTRLQQVLLAHSTSTRALPLGVHKWTQYKLSTASTALMWFARHRTKPRQQVFVIRDVRFISVTSSPRYYRKSVFKNQFLLDSCSD